MSAGVGMGLPVCDGGALVGVGKFDCVLVSAAAAGEAGCVGAGAGAGGFVPVPAVSVEAAV